MLVMLVTRYVKEITASQLVLVIVIHVVATVHSVMLMITANAR